MQGSLLSGDQILFDAVQVDGCAVRTIDVVNAGTRELILLEAGISGQDFLLLGQLPEQLAPGEKDSFDVYILPLAPGTRRGHLTIKTNDTNKGTFVLEVREPYVE